MTLLLIVILIPLPASGFTDMCRAAEKALGMTSAQIKAFYNNDIKNWRVEGSGEIYDVRLRRNDACTVVVHFDGDAFITMEL
jgi:hypothetical protein